jgi:hypothetical protein
MPGAKPAFAVAPSQTVTVATTDPELPMSELIRVADSVGEGAP